MLCKVHYDIKSKCQVYIVHVMSLALYKDNANGSFAFLLQT